MPIFSDFVSTVVEAAQDTLDAMNKMLTAMLANARTCTAVFISSLAILSLQPASAQGVRIENKVAVFSALDKVTARISTIEIPLNETIQFGSLKVTPRVCYSRPATERPKTTSFVEVREVQLDGKEEKLFSGWMFAESPALNAVEHPVFDVWLTGCKGGIEPEIVRRRARRPSAGSEEEAAPPPAPRRRRRVRR